MHLKLAGELDVVTLAAVERELDAVLAGNPHQCIHVDLADVTFIDSSTIGAFIRAQRRAVADDGGLLLHHPAPNVRRVLEIMALTHLLGDPLDRVSPVPDINVN
jgi:anti-sigma B factor antagonist